MSKSERDELPEDLIVAIGAYLLLEKDSGFAERGSIAYVRTKPQLAPLLIEEEE